MDNAIILMSEGEARQTIIQIKTGMMDISTLILDLHNREGWRALGYESWRECIKAEFDFSQSRGYQLLAHGEVIQTLKDSSMLEKVPLPTNQRQTEPLTKLPPTEQPKAWATAVKEAGNKQPTGKQVASIVEKQYGLSKSAQIARSKPAAPKRSISTSGAGFGAGPSVDSDFGGGYDDDTNQDNSYQFKSTKPASLSDALNIIENLVYLVHHPDDTTFASDILPEAEQFLKNAGR